MPLGKEGVKFVIFVVDYFTEWVEAKALATITTNNKTRFLWKVVVCQFRIPWSIISDNRQQFDFEHY